MQSTSIEQPERVLDVETAQERLPQRGDLVTPAAPVALAHSHIGSRAG